RHVIVPQTSYRSHKRGHSSVSDSMIVREATLITDGLRPDIAPRTGNTCYIIRSLDNVRMDRHFRFKQRHSLFAGGFAEVPQRQPRALAWMHRRSVLQIWKGEIAFPIASVRCPQQRE